MQQQPTTVSPQEFLEGLYSMYETKEKSAEGIAKFIYEKQTELVCRHSADCSYCKIVGTIDSSHGRPVAVMRRTTLYNWFIKDSRAKPALFAHIKPGANSTTNIQVHQLAAMVNNGLRPSGMLIRHLCGCGVCTNIDHLVYGTDQENKEDAHWHHVWNTIWDTDRDLVNKMRTDMKLGKYGPDSGVF